jgi:hypothetical protein
VAAEPTPRPEAQLTVAGDDEPVLGAEAAGWLARIIRAQLPGPGRQQPAGDQLALAGR